MQSWSELLTAAQDGVQDYTTPSLTYLKAKLNKGRFKIQDLLGSFYTEDTRNTTTTAANKTVEIPADILDINTVYVTVSGKPYAPTEVFSELHWQRILSIISSSDIPQKFFRRKNTIELWPTPVTSNTISFVGPVGGKKLQNLDYTTGNILTLTNGTSAVVGTGTTWTAAMVGRYIKVNADDQWYEISAFTNATNITLRKKYLGTSISTSTAYTIGELTGLPDILDDVVLDYAWWKYWEELKKDKTFAKIHKQAYDEGLEMGVSRYASRYKAQVIPSQAFMETATLGFMLPETISS